MSFRYSYFKLKIKLNVFILEIKCQKVHGRKEIICHFESGLVF